MRLLVISDHVEDLARVQCYTDVWSHFLVRALREQGCEIRLEPSRLVAEQGGEDLRRWVRSAELAGTDHVLALGLRYFTRVPRDTASLMQERLPRGATIAQLTDRAMGGAHVPPQVWSLHVAGPSSGERRCVQIGWGADAELLRPEQDPTELRILIDHPHYGGPDDSRVIATDALEFARSGLWREAGWRGVRLRRLCDGGAEDLLSGSERPRRFSRKHVPYVEICAEYRATHVFVPTHHESVGLTVLETATCGALPVVRRGHVSLDRLDTVRHLTYDLRVPWDRVLPAVDPPASRRVAEQSSWAAVAARVTNHFRSMVA